MQCALENCVQQTLKWNFFALSSHSDGWLGLFRLLNAHLPAFFFSACFFIWSSCFRFMRINVNLYTDFYHHMNTYEKEHTPEVGHTATEKKSRGKKSGSGELGRGESLIDIHICEKGIWLLKSKNLNNFINMKYAGVIYDFPYDFFTTISLSLLVSQSASSFGQQTCVDVSISIHGTSDIFYLGYYAI